MGCAVNPRSSLPLRPEQAALFGVLWAGRWGERARHRRGLLDMRGTRNVLIVGAGALGHRIANYLEKHPEMGRSVFGFLDDWKPLGNGVIGRIAELAELARAGFVDEVILAGPHDRGKTLRVLRTAQQLRLDVKMAPDLFGCEPTRETERIGGIPLISLHEERLPVAGLWLKRALDLMGAGAALSFWRQRWPCSRFSSDWIRQGPCSIRRRARDARADRFAATSFAPWFGTPTP